MMDVDTLLVFAAKIRKMASDTFGPGRLHLTIIDTTRYAWPTYEPRPFMSSQLEARDLPEIEQRLRNNVTNAQGELEAFLKDKEEAKRKWGDLWENYPKAKVAPDDA